MVSYGCCTLMTGERGVFQSTVAVHVGRPPLLYSTACPYCTGVTVAAYPRVGRYAKQPIACFCEGPRFPWRHNLQVWARYSTVSSRRGKPYFQSELAVLQDVSVAEML